MSYLKFLVLVLIFSKSVLKGHSQLNETGCGTPSQSQEWEKEFQQLSLKSSANLQARTSSANYVIPVIFHVVHGGEPIGTFPNILSGQINSQITILNQDFSGNAYNKSNYPINAFANWAASQNIPTENLDENGRIKIADFNIQFCAANIDTNGNLLTEPGIDRINYIAKGWPDPTQYGTQTTMKNYLDNVVKPASIWDATKYLNIWITDKSNLLNYAGVSSVPPLSTLADLPNNTTTSTDGIWCYTKVIGSYQMYPSGSYISSFIDGRTLTHEVGHYVGLRHIWGDSDCGNDFCKDTPPASGQNTGSPTYPLNPGSCNLPSNNPDGEMFMNFMDYTMGPSKYMFTTDQKIRAITVMLNSPFRKELGTHNLCHPLHVDKETIDTEKWEVYPNPTNGNVNVWTGKQLPQIITLKNQYGAVIKETNSAEFSIEELLPGVYFLHVQKNNQIRTLKISKL
jgi:hypothetical protein